MTGVEETGSPAFLFVVGAARSGTTILQNALNDAAEVYLLGEPDLHLHGDEAGFATRYNAMHRSWRNHENKSSFLPILNGHDGTWREALAALGRHYHRVGSKIVFNAASSARSAPRWADFHIAHFYDARYIFTFRDPERVIRSTIDLQLYSGAPAASVAALIANYARVVALFTRMVRILPHVRALFHEDMERLDWNELGGWLGVDCSGAPGYYDPPSAPSTGAPFDPADMRLVGPIRDLYEDLRAAARPPLFRTQIEQNEGHIDPGHFTPLGSVHRRALLILEGAEARA